MSESGVIPRPEERQPNEVGGMKDVHGISVEFGLGGAGTVRVCMRLPGSDKYGFADFDAAKRDEFMRLWCEAERQAETTNG